MQLQHTVTHELPLELAHQARSAGLTQQQVTDLFQRYGQLAITILQGILSVLPQAKAAQTSAQDAGQATNKAAGAAPHQATPPAEHRPTEKPPKG